MSIERALKLPERPTQSMFLWGPRQAGKTTLLREMYPDATWVDLLKTDEFVKYTQAPMRLREELDSASHHPIVIIDEIQKVPALMDEVHWLIENRQIIFILCGSSARKLKQSHANMLGGRALRYELFGFVYAEIKAQFDLLKVLNYGYLPSWFLAASPRPMINSYVADYLKDEIAAEGLVRNLGVFANFLEAASLSDTEVINLSNIARECGVSEPTVKGYFQILTDTLLGFYLEAFRLRPKRRTVQSPKFYFSDVGLVNHLARRGGIALKSELIGKAFENFIFHELKAYLSYRQIYETISYWRLTSKFEVDFIIGRARYAIEAKASENIHDSHLKGLREFKSEYPTCNERVVVCLEKVARTTADGIRILPLTQFLDALWQDELLQLHAVVS